MIMIYMGNLDKQALAQQHDDATYSIPLAALRGEGNVMN
jgi:hypothetical protein